jgi:long-chain fatty acid transport protein
LRSATRLLLLLSLLTLVWSGSALASGFALPEQGAKAVAMGGAFAATADDPSAIYYNVAGLAQQRHAEVLVGGTVINFANEFRGDPNDPFTSGQTGRYRAHTFIPPNAYFILPIGSNLTAGVGIMTPFGLRTNWTDPWVGRFVSRDANVKVISVEPALAWQTTGGNLAVGVGGEYRRGRLALNRNNGAINPFTGRIVDVANAYLSSDWDSTWAWNAGVLLKFNNHWRIGASYRTDAHIDFTGDATFTQIPTGSAQLDAIVKAGLPPNQSISTTINFPATLMVGVATSAIPRWDFEVDAWQTTWSQFQNLDVVFGTTPSANLHRPQNWKDSMSYRMGANHTVTDHWDVRFGALYDQNPQPTEGVGPLLPDSDREGVSFGIGYHRGPWIIDATEFALHFKTRSTGGISNDNFNGTYKTDANLISVNFGYRFGR